jgi:hypothetical protein
MNDREQDFVRKVRGELHRSLTDLDDTTLARLDQGRRHALRRDSAATGRHPLALAGIFGGAVATLLLLFTTVFSPFGEPGTDNAIIAEMSLFTEEESLEFFSDIEFYEWLSALDGEDSSASGAPTPFDHHHPDLVEAGMGAAASSSGRASGWGIPRIPRII